MNKFKELGISEVILKSINNLGFSTPTEIQSKTIPFILKGKDVIGQSATGSGKTLAFGCGIIEKIIPGNGLQALVLTPTRELAQQVKQNIEELIYQQKLKITMVYGGVSLDHQVRNLQKANILVATPGRLLDHLRRKNLKLDNINLLVLDEADRMLDMGFIDDVEQIIKMCPINRQTLFFSATMPPKIKQLANKYMKDSINLSAQKFVDHSKLKQIYYNVQRNIKFSLLVHLLNKEDSGLVMVFCNTRRTVDFVENLLKSVKLNAIGIHGGNSQSKRNYTLQNFTKSKSGILICTDVAARGLHIDNVSHIYNYDIPRDPTDYVHRIGRTARAGEKGKVVNLLSEQDHDNFRRIFRDYSEFNIQKIERPYIKKVKVNLKPRRRKRNFSKRKKYFK